ncbi:hypothetical protein PHLGIDRAFT_181427 [Phlebiopsis gigantea 11061_1 CR5-6]|uniref:Uncharacterized protein n=1 Tax=Phlebiopsis gigantea (strain 11061_1 CR5-6) TaxID=745531 RepID=A0A0C3S428_PHLG1|nr:hypothetical protein PHLGIDRAFT_181427 [Phlebiopsis gigantea 11061_1 CR5-6]
MVLAPLLHDNFSNEPDRPPIVFEYTSGKLGVKLSDLDNLTPQVESTIEDGLVKVSDGQFSKSSFAVEIFDLCPHKDQKYAHHMQSGSQTGNTRAKVGQQAAQVIKAWFNHIVRKTKDEFNPFDLGAEGRAFEDLYLVALAPKSGTKRMYTCIIGYYPITPEAAETTSISSSSTSVQENLIIRQDGAYALDAFTPKFWMPLNTQAAPSDAAGSDRTSTFFAGLPGVQHPDGFYGTDTHSDHPMSCDTVAQNPTWPPSEASPAPLLQHSAVTDPRQSVRRTYSVPEQRLHNNSSTSHSTRDFAIAESSANPSFIESNNWFDLESWINIPPADGAFSTGQSIAYADPDTYPPADISTDIMPRTNPVASTPYNSDGSRTICPDGRSRYWTQ